jgi:hypothetical protein
VKKSLVVMGKAPLPGEVKTRLVAGGALSAEDAAALYRCFLLDTLDLASRVSGVDTVLFFTPESAEALIRAMVPSANALVAQQGEDLAQRMVHIIDHQFHQGYEAVVLVGSDLPTLPLDYLNRAFAELEKPSVDLVLGPSQDGGYYLIGVKRPCPELLLDVNMSTPTVLKDTVGIAEGLGLEVILIPPWYDIDTKEDLARLRTELDSDPKPDAVRTKHFLDSHD